MGVSSAGLAGIAVTLAAIAVLAAWTDRNDMDSSLGPVNPCTDLFNPSCLGPVYTETEAAAAANKLERSQARYNTRAWLYAAAVALIAAVYLGARLLLGRVQADKDPYKELRIVGLSWLVVASVALAAQHLAEGDSVQIPLIQAYFPGAIMLAIGTIGSSRPWAHVDGEPG